MGRLWTAGRAGLVEFVIAAFAVSAVVLAAVGEGPSTAKAGLCFAGLLVARQIGVRRSSAAILAIALLALVWAGTPAFSGVDWVANTLAHLVGGGLVAWVVADWIAERSPEIAASPLRIKWLIVLSLVLLIGAAWELGEWSSEALFGTDPSLRVVDSLVDILTTLVGALGGLVCLTALGAYRPKPPL